ncbi:MAG TPA: ubiquinol oxidase subunit II [Candidatus Saccharimonadales bacterium]|nr:ubiquinol oxidase subunit II [Candidatus Saccharimonadales bacterium]
MNKKRRFAFMLCASLLTVALGGWYLAHTNIPVLEPTGSIGTRERNLIVFALLLSLIVVIPVFTMAIAFAWRYRESNQTAAYRPDFTHSRLLETAWWAIPGLLILILSIVTWNSTHSLDPYKSISASTNPLVVDVVALDWKWLFIYPAQHVASVNLLVLPINTPIRFNITADAPMNSFWIPQLGGQIYAMPGMSTQLHLEASKVGDYYGSSANISGSGFAGMTFTARVASATDFMMWLQAATRAQHALTMAVYDALAQPSKNNPAVEYSSVDPGLYSAILAKYMSPSPAPGTMNYQTSGMQGMGM